jgi:2'-5' RNA ligase
MLACGVVPDLLAIDVAILPPLDVAQQAIALSAALPRAESQGLRLDNDHLPHITLSQHFITAAGLESALSAIGEVVRGMEPLPLRVRGGGQGSSSVWMAVDRTPALQRLHADVMVAVEPFERTGGAADAFHGGDARPRDIEWVSSFRRESAFDRFTPHITLGHAARPPHVEPFPFTAVIVAACHLGRFCTCRHVLRSWSLGRG